MNSPNGIKGVLRHTCTFSYHSNTKIEVDCKGFFLNFNTGTIEVLKPLQMNNINGYNWMMGNFDIYGQLCSNYRLDKFVRNKKRWSLIFLIFGLLPTKEHVYYTNVCDK